MWQYSVHTISTLYVLRAYIHAHSYAYAYRHVFTSKHMRTDMYLPVSICRYVSSSMRTQVSTCIYRYMYAGIYLLIHVSGYVSTSTCM
mgnify:CR=1 FL=1